MTSAEVPMIVRLPGSRTLTAMLLERPLDPTTWTSLTRQAGGGTRQRGRAAVEALMLGLPPEDAHKEVYVQHRMDELGRHEYLDLSALARQLREGRAPALAVVGEDAVKPKMADGMALVFTAQPVQGMVMPTALPPRSAEDAWLCPPMSLHANYSICEQLTLGRTQRVMLADEATLSRGGPSMPPIFNHISLVVNCHQDASAARPGKYRLGTAAPSVLFEPVHKLYGAQPPAVVHALRAIVEQMWAALQRGSVVVHCLAGLHRAPAVVACFYLYRHHVLGHESLPAEISEIYDVIRTIRPSVAPLGYIELIRVFERAVRAEREHTRQSRADAAAGSMHALPPVAAASVAM
ncbi:hypothetical protein KFE25_001278 [Diacronema lutheri]|uniref:Tyrosine specific protein phosphatases domain-containing protein n=1 Tax=Diacronema lutheri TaxID=2081491 RepID=A0A7R9UXY9_DIALT|nr:hypothetical protein KFE25_001278 [Diacronema lutheri]|mmetsp:Transcript_8829/g.27748  ORF Transcript_8829/g.27748 Transcript_8829/m.27748 type:complete len:350 (+) Transcript_8829:76-1125(+)